MEKLELKLKNGDSSCVVFSGRNLYGEISSYIKTKKAAKFVIITDSKVGHFHGNNFFSKLKSDGIECFMINFPDGEKNKTRETKAFLEDEMFREK